MRILRVLLPALVAASALDAAHPSLPPPVVPECLGVNIHFTDPKPGEMEMLAAAGFKWVRMDLTWAGTERKVGEYDFAAYDRLVAALNKFKIRAVFILDYGNKVYPNAEPPTTDEARTAFAKWAVAAVSHFKGHGYLWEMWNEPNGGFWKSPDKTADYIALAKATGEALRKAGLTGEKGEAYIGPATSTIDLPYLEACFQAGLLDYWDAVSVHPYRQSAPETVEEEYRSVRLLIRKYAPAGKEIPIVSGEWGYSTQYPAFAGKDSAARDEQQAKWLARQFLTNIANDVALSIWYDWHDDGTDPKEPEHHFGVVRHEYRPGRDPVYDPKPAYTAMKTMTEQLGGLRFNKRLALFRLGYPYLYVFGNEHDLKLVLSPYGLEDIPDQLDIRLELRGDYHYAGWQGIEGERLLTSYGLDVKLPRRQFPIYLEPVLVTDALKVMAAFKRLPLEFVWEWRGTAAKAISNPDIESWPAIRNPLKHTIIRTDPRHRLTLVQPGEVIPINRAADIVPWDLKYILDHPWPQKTHVCIETCGEVADGDWFAFGQQATFICDNPLLFSILPPGDDFLPIEIQNPSRRHFEGLLMVQRGSDAYDMWVKQPFDFAEGEKEKVVVEVALPNLEDRSELRIMAATSRLESIELTREVDRSFRFRRQVISPLKTMKAIVDGSRDSSSLASLASGVPPAGPPVSQTTALHLRYRMEAGWKFVRVVTDARELPLGFATDSGWGVLAFGLWLHGDGKGCQARIRFKDSTGQVFQPDGPKIDWKGWRYVTFPMQSTEEKPLAHWGGKNDGVIHYPIEWDSIFLLDNVSRHPVEGEIYLSAPTLIY